MMMNLWIFRVHLQEGDRSPGVRVETQVVSLQKM